MKEYGGYLPLELRDGQEYYSSASDKIVKCYNSGRTAIMVALMNLRPKRIFIPHYICETVNEAVKKVQGIEIKHYFLDETMLPKDITFENGDCLLIVNYFGLMRSKIENYLLGIPDIDILVDNTQAFFAQPFPGDKTHHIYSCRKFIGVSDGAYLITGKHLKVDLSEEGFSSGCAQHLFSSVEYGTNSAYMENKINEQHISEVNCNMSLLTRKLLKNADYEQIKHRRISNFNYLREKFRSNNLLKVELADENKIPYVYPLLVEQPVREELIENKIYTPILWAELLDIRFFGTLENYIAEHTVFLPIDQRYQSSDMDAIAETVSRILK